MEDKLKNELNRLYSEFKSKKSYEVIDKFRDLKSSSDLKSSNRITRDYLISFCESTTNPEVLIVGSTFLHYYLGNIVANSGKSAVTAIVEKLSEVDSVLLASILPRLTSIKPTRSAIANTYRRLGFIEITKKSVGAMYPSITDESKIEVITEALKIMRDTLTFFGEVGSIPRLYLEKPDKFGTDVILVGTYEGYIEGVGAEPGRTQQFGCRLKDKAGNRYDFILPINNHNNAPSLVMKEYNIVGRGRDEEYLPIKRIYDGDKLCGYIVKHTIDDQSREELMGRAVALGVCARGLIPTCSVDKSSNVLRGRQIKMGDLPKIQKSELQISK